MRAAIGTTAVIQDPAAADSLRRAEEARKAAEDAKKAAEAAGRQGN